MLNELPEDMLIMIAEKIITNPDPEKCLSLESRLSVVSLSGVCRATRQACYKIDMPRNVMPTYMELEYNIILAEPKYMKKQEQKQELLPLETHHHDARLPAPPEYDDPRYCDYVRMDPYLLSKWRRDLTRQVMKFHLFNKAHARGQTGVGFPPLELLFYLKVLVRVVVSIPRACRYSNGVPIPILELVDQGVLTNILHAHHVMVKSPTPYMRYEWMEFPEAVRIIRIPGVHRPKTLLQHYGWDNDEWTTLYDSDPSHLLPRPQPSFVKTYPTIDRAPRPWFGLLLKPPSNFRYDEGYIPGKSPVSYKIDSTPSEWGGRRQEKFLRELKGDVCFLAETGCQCGDCGDCGMFESDYDSFEEEDSGDSGEDNASGGAASEGIDTISTDDLEAITDMLLNESPPPTAHHEFGGYTDETWEMVNHQWLQESC